MASVAREEAPIKPAKGRFGNFRHRAVPLRQRLLIATKSIVPHYEPFTELLQQTHWVDEVGIKWCSLPWRADGFVTCARQASGAGGVGTRARRPSLTSSRAVLSPAGGPDPLGINDLA
jgi:hypothetical protein